MKNSTEQKAWEIALKLFKMYALGRYAKIQKVKINMCRRKYRYRTLLPNGTTVKDLWLGDVQYTIHTNPYIRTRWLDDVHYGTGRQEFVLLQSKYNA